jgi:alpha,alpha-trehalase
MRGAAGAFAGTLLAPWPSLGESAQAGAVPAASLPVVDREAWEQLDATIRGWWDSDLSRATEKEVRQDTAGQLLFLPFPYIGPTGPDRVFSFMFAWDTDFVNRALIAHERMDLVRNHIRNYLFMIDRFGYMPNANVMGVATRSQTPLAADTLWRYFLATKDRDLLHEAYPRLKRNYREYWTAEHHQTPIGLATNRDLGDRGLTPELASEAEVGLDWTPIYGSDVRRCVPLLTNSALVRFARALSKIATSIGIADEARLFAQEARHRTELMRRYCWNESSGYFLEYDYVAGKQLPYISDSAFWALWAGVPTRAQARRLVGNLNRLEQAFGISSTDKAYPLTQPERFYIPCAVAPEGKSLSATDAGAVGGHNPFQWMYPAGWAPAHLICVEGLDAYGYSTEAQRIAAKFLSMLLDRYRETGRLWEKYNVVDGTVVLPNARCGNIWMHGWTAAAAALLGRRVLRNERLGVA